MGLKLLSLGVERRQFVRIEGEGERVVIQRPLDSEVIKHRKPLTYYRANHYSSVSLGYSLIIDEAVQV